jgi:hypothetical protein
MGINRWSGGIEERKRNETDAKAGEEEVPKGKKGDTSSRMESSEEPTENEQKRQVTEKLKEQEQQQGGSS